MKKKQYFCTQITDFVHTIISYITQQLTPFYPPDETQSLAWWIAEELTECTRTHLQIGYKGTTNFPHLQIGDPFLDKIIVRLQQYEPIQYIFGHTLWNGLDLVLTPATLIPRPETAELVQAVHQLARTTQTNRPLRVADIGTGSGCIAISIKKQHPDWTVTAMDISSEALSVAAQNAIRNGVEIQCRQCDILSDEIECFDIIVSNPPYICERERTSMRANVLNYEPATALFVPDADPLVFYRRIASLRASAFLCFEINENFAADMRTLLEKEGYTDIQLIYDMYGKPRIIQARLLA